MVATLASQPEFVNLEGCASLQRRGDCYRIISNIKMNHDADLLLMLKSDGPLDRS
jgi:hypothetical protein